MLTQPVEIHLPPPKSNQLHLPESHLALHLRWKRRLLGLGAVLFLLTTTAGCAFSELLVPPPTSTPVPTRTLEPTFTPTPEALQPLVVVTPPRDGTPGVIVIQPTIDGDRIVIAIPPTDTPVPPPTETPSPTPTAPPLEQTATAAALIAQMTAEAPITPIPGLPIPTATPLPTETMTPGPTATPFIVVDSGFVALRTGPGVQYPQVAQLGSGIPIAIIGRNTQGDWYEVCCVNGASVWVVASHVRVVNETQQVALVVAQPPPTFTPTFTPTETPTATFTPTATLFPFERAIGPQFFPTENQFLTIWAYFFVGALNDTLQPEEPVEGYFLDVRFKGVERPNTNTDRPSTNVIQYSAAEGSGNRVKYNYKYEYRPPNQPTPAPDQVATPRPCELLGQGAWQVWVRDGAGNQLSDVVEFSTDCNNPNREIYLGFVRMR
ncbi:SH3 domain-containing protein [Caldilinea sp.]|uniref:SH3 domain-containing protein n=1 Tax=Caldilinea sp. TaxID=2293560 RepID=UPI002CB7F884|nr:SH3 domain-containing protein [Caldilinea sp.]